MRAKSWMVLGRCDAGRDPPVGCVCKSRGGGSAYGQAAVQIRERLYGDHPRRRLPIEQTGQSVAAIIAPIGGLVMGRSSWVKNPTRCSAASTWQSNDLSASSAQPAVKSSRSAAVLNASSSGENA